MLYKHLGYRKTEDDIINRAEFTRAYHARQGQAILLALLLLSFAALIAWWAP